MATTYNSTLMRTANPALNDKSFSGMSGQGVAAGDVMTLDGTVNKTLISIGITTAAGYYSFLNPAMASMMPIFLIGTLIVCLVLIFKKNLAPALTPVYAGMEGCLLGSISLFAEMRYPGIAFQAISLTFGTLFCLLFAYKSGMIKPSENFKLGLAAATGAIFFVYLLNMIMSLFGMPFAFLHSAGPFGILISVVVVIIAALNLVLDFDFIENAAASRSAPKYMEWYGAFGLLVTLVWLYLEILRLLMKLNDRRN